jgi:hypothetical protein
MPRPIEIVICLIVGAIFLWIVALGAAYWIERIAHAFSR